MTSLRIPFQRPTMPNMESALNYFSRSLEARYFSNGGPCAQLFEVAVAERAGTQHAVLVNNATSGLMVAARALFARRRPDGYVIVPSFTFAATAAALEWAGYEPLFCDIDPLNLHLDPAALRNALVLFGDRIAGVLACSTFGVAPPLGVSTAWEELCSQAGVPLLVDSAAGFGSTFESGVSLGRQGNAEVFSFHATKPFAIGEGGAVTSNDGDLVAEIRRLINFGFDDQRVVSGAVGINAKMPEILCAIGLAAMEEFDSVLNVRRSLSLRIVEGLGLDASIQPNLTRAAVQFVPILVDASRRVELLSHLAEAGIEARLYFDPPLHMMPSFSRHACGPLQGTNLVAGRVVSLPMFNDMTTEQADEIISIVGRTLSTVTG